MDFIQYRSAKQKVRLITLVILLAVFVCVLFFKSGEPSAQNTIDDPDDGRPVQRILFIGNSRTYANDMPAMVREMGRERGRGLGKGQEKAAPFRYEITVHALGGHTFEDHYQNPAVQKLLAQQWDYVVLQGGSPENTNPDSSVSFAKYGQSLVGLVQKAGSQPVLLTAWAYDENSYDSENEIYLKPYYLEYAASYQDYIAQHGKPPEGRSAPETFFPLDIKKHYAFIQRDYDALSDKTNALMVNVGEAFRELLVSSRFKTLTSDGNHPNLQGSYLMAAMFHVCFSKEPASAIGYRPSGLSEDDAMELLAFIDRFYPSGTCLVNP